MHRLFCKSYSDNIHTNHRTLTLFPNNIMSESHHAKVRHPVTY